jgi:hypothetical protein
MNIWIKNSKGQRDAVLTFTLVGFVVCMLKVLFGGSVFVVYGYTLNFGPIDATTIGAILGPTLGSYVARRWNDGKSTKPADESPAP